MDTKPMEQTAEKSVRKQQLENCYRFFKAVADELKDTHVILGPKNKSWQSACLVPKGLENQVTYNGKPHNSLRVACNWNWRASKDKCERTNYVQCFTLDLPWPKSRPDNDLTKASKPIWGNMVGYFDDDNQYHCVFGEKYDRKTKQWIWVMADPKTLADKMRQYAKDHPIVPMTNKNIPTMEETASELEIE